MNAHLLAWVGAAVLLLLCLPIPGTRKLVLEVYAWALRLALLALLVGGAILWFRPELLPAEAARVVDAFPLAGDLLPATGSPAFGLAAAVLVTAVLLPLLAALDVTRKLAGRRLRPLVRLADAAWPEATAATPGRPALRTHLPGGAQAQRRPDRRAAAETMAEIGSRQPFRVADHLS
jgi:hypothetical protein